MNNLEITKVTVTPDGRVSRSDAAKFLGFKPKTLAEWHRKGIGPHPLGNFGRTLGRWR